MKEKYRHPEPSDKGLLAHWKLWDGLTSASAVFDYSLNGNVGTPTGTDIAPAYPGFAFNATDDFINVASLDALSGQAYTSMAWIWISGGAGTRRTVFNTEANFTISIEVDQNNKLSVVADRATAFAIVTSTDDVPTGQWVHVASVYNAGTLTGYVNGISVGSNSDGAGNLLTYTSLTIGSITADRFFDGFISDVRIYNPAFTAGEIKSMFELTRWRYAA